MKINTEKVALYIAVIVLGIFLYMEKCNSTKYSDKTAIELANALQDSLRVLKNKDSSTTATISVLRTESAKNFLLLQSKDKEVIALQVTVKDYLSKLKAGNSVTNALLETLVNTQGTTVIQYKDTVIYNDKLTYIYPEYSDSLMNEWISYKGRMNKDSSFLNLKVYNSFSAVVGTYKKKPFVDLTLNNPYSAVRELRTYQVMLPKPKRFGFGLSTGGTLNSKFQFTPYVGIGFNYNFIRF